MFDRVLRAVAVAWGVELHDELVLTSGCGTPSRKATLNMSTAQRPAEPHDLAELPGLHGASVVRLGLRTVRGVMYAPLVGALRLGGEATRRDIRRQLQPRLDLPLPEEVSYAELLGVVRHKPFRSILYHRLRTAGLTTKVVSVCLAAMYRGEPAMTIACDDIGPGLMLMHGFATIITARRLGVDCQVSQQVTVGYDDRGDCPILGDRVRIGANAVVLGPITIGDDAVIGAGAVVVKDVPAGVVVGGVPAKILTGATDRFSARARN
jgi:serine O-acetyltransferase